MKKILIVNDFKFEGGAETVVKLQGEYLKDLYHVDYFYGIDYLEKKNPLNYIYSFGIKKKLIEQVSKNKYDIIHIHNYYHHLSPSIFVAISFLRRKGMNLKVFYTAHDYHLVCPNSGFFYYKNREIKNFQKVPSIGNFLFKRLDNRFFIYDILKKAQWINAYCLHKYHEEIDHIITPSYFLKNVLQKAVKKPITVIRNPIEITELTDNTSNNVWNDNSVNKINIVFLGRLSVEKGLFEFIDLLSNIKELEYTLAIYGDGPEKERVSRLIGSKNLGDSIILKGRTSRDQLLRELGRYNTFVLPSLWYENAPMSIIEAASAGLLLLTTGHGGMVEIAEECGGGFYFTPGNVDSLTLSLTKIKTILENDRVTYDRKSFLEKFSVKNFKNSLIDLYKS